MNYSQLVKIFSIIVLVFNFLEKALSYVGQSAFPDSVFEGNPLARPVINYLGITMGHVVMLFTAFAAILTLRWIGLYSPFILKNNPRQREIVMAICLFALGYFALDCLRVFYHNAYILWESLI